MSSPDLQLDAVVLSYCVQDASPRERARIISHLQSALILEKLGLQSSMVCLSLAWGGAWPQMILIADGALRQSITTVYVIKNLSR